MSQTVFEKNFDMLKESMNTATEEHFSCAEECIRMTGDAFRNGNKLLLCGNGGSASTASHITNDFVGHMKNWEREGYPAIALTADISVLTALSNDYGFDYVFSKQVSALGREGDILWAFSVSGNSANVIEAVKAAKEKKMKVVLFTRKSSGKLNAMVDLCIPVNTDDFMTAEALHLFYVHSIAESIEAELTPLNKK